MSWLRRFLFTEDDPRYLSAAERARKEASERLHARLEKLNAPRKKSDTQTISFPPAPPARPTQTQAVLVHSPSPPIYQVSGAFTEDPPNTWRDASERAYDLHPLASRRIVHAESPVSVADWPASQITPVSSYRSDDEPYKASCSASTYTPEVSRDDDSNKSSFSIDFGSSSGCDSSSSDYSSSSDSSSSSSWD